MGRNIKGRKPRREKNAQIIKQIRIIVIFVLLGAGIYLYRQFNILVMPTVIAVSEMQARNVAVNTVNKAVKETLIENDIESDDLVTYYYNENNEVIACGINTIKINQLCVAVIEKITYVFQEAKEMTLHIPYGAATGNDILANYGPDFSVSILPVGTVSVNYDREFVSTGINQINHRVWLDINAVIQIVIPMATKKININQQFVLVDRVLKGNVPSSYVEVPKEDILDVAP